MDIPEAVRRDFNAGRYRACVEPLEELYFKDRAPFYQGLIKLSVALLQIERGLKPVRLLEGAAGHLRQDGSAGALAVAERAEEILRWLAGDRTGSRPHVEL